MDCACYITIHRNGDPMITTFKIKLLCGVYCQDEWSANMELDESATLEDLHLAIQTLSILTKIISTASSCRGQTGAGVENTLTTNDSHYPEGIP